VGVEVVRERVRMKLIGLMMTVERMKGRGWVQ